MKEAFTATSTVVINALSEEVWRALTDPDLIKAYLFGTEVTSDWQEGSPITYKGEWKGEPYEDKGTIQTIEPKKHIIMTYWSPLSGTEDSPENYSTVGYYLEEGSGTTKLTVTQDNNASQEEADKAENNWNSVLDSIKKMLEK